VTPGVEITGDEVGVQIIGGRNIVVSNPDAGFSITYRKDGVAPMLVAIDGIDRSSEPARIKFWAQRHPIRLVALDQTSPKLYGKAPDGGRGPGLFRFQIGEPVTVGRYRHRRLGMAARMQSNTLGAKRRAGEQGRDKLILSYQSEKTI
jgi:hypothetical protein